MAAIRQIIKLSEVKNMQALVYTGPNILEIQEVETPVPAAGQALIRVTVCGICGSDIHGYTGRTGRRIPPVIMGHEFAGVVAAVGAGVTACQAGQRVTVQPIIYCGHCEACRAGRTTNCPDKQCLGCLSLNGAMAEYICVDERFVKILPDHVTDRQAALIEPLAVAYRAVSRIPVAGQTVLVVGAGTIGLLVLKMLLAKGAGPVIVSDRSDYRLQRARESGASRTVNPDREDLGQVIAALTGGLGVDIAIEAVGIGPTVSQALNSLKPAGQCVWIGNSARMIEINMQQIVTRELAIFGTYSYTDADFDQALALVADRQIDVDPLADGRVDLAGAAAIFAQLAGGADQPVKCLIEMVG